jgi:hypothetical protein
VLRKAVGSLRSPAALLLSPAAKRGRYVSNRFKVKPDDLLFGIPAPPFVETARRIVRKNRANVNRSFPAHLARHEALLDALYAFECAHVWTFHLSRRSPTPIEQLVFSASHKNLIALFGILENVQAGLLGSARPLFRQILEGQLLAKYAAVVNDVDLAERWSRRESLSVPKVVLAKLYPAQSDVLRRLWQSSHVFVHSSTGSQQVSINAETNIDLIAHDLTVMGMLLHTQVHLTTQHTFTRAEGNVPRLVETWLVPQGCCSGGSER